MCKASHHLTVIVTRSTQGSILVVVACCFDCSPSPLSFLSHNYLTWLSIFQTCACKHRHSMGRSFLTRCFETVFVCHAEASVGSQCEFRVSKKKEKKVNWGSCSVRQPTDRKEGQATLRLGKLLSSIPLQKQHLSFSGLYGSIHAGKKGELELSSTPSPFPVDNILFWTQPAPVFMSSLWL